MMETSQTTPNEMDYGRAVKHTARAAELLGAALGVLREDDGVVGINAIAERVAEATNGLARARHASQEDLFQMVLDANGALGEALRAAADRKLPARQTQSLEAIRRAIILLNGIARHGGHAIMPPPLPHLGRRSQEPAGGVAERREHPRAFLETQVTFESADNFYTGFTEDVSEGGLFLATYDLRPMGTSIEIEFTLPDGHIVRTTCLVRWVRDPRDEMPDAPPGMGLQFAELRPEDRRAIDRFIENRAPLFYED